MAEIRIWLAGLMGSGKSTLGRALAGRLGCEYVDNDATIERLAGRSTVELARAGDGLLHDWESRYAWHLAGLPAPVIAGIPASAADRPADLAVLRTSGLLVYLRCDLDTLIGRIKADPPRPWADHDIHGLITGMLATRDPVFAATADLIIDGAARTETSVALIIQELRNAE